MISNTVSSWRCVAGNESVLGSVLFYWFINDLDKGTECTLSKSDDAKVRGVAAIQLNLEKLQSWVERNLKFKGKCRVTHWCRL